MLDNTRTDGSSQGKVRDTNTLKKPYSILEHVWSQAWPEEMPSKILVAQASLAAKMTYLEMTP